MGQGPRAQGAMAQGAGKGAQGALRGGLRELYGEWLREPNGKGLVSCSN